MNATEKAAKRREKRARMEVIIKKFQAQGVKIGFVPHILSMEGLQCQSSLRQAD